MKTATANALRIAPDDVLGRSYCFFGGNLLTVIARDPNKGWLLTGQGYDKAWVSDLMMTALLAEGVLS